MDKADGGGNDTGGVRLATADEVLGALYLVDPVLAHTLLEVFDHLGILQILGVRVDGVDGRVALLVGAVLCQ